MRVWRGANARVDRKRVTARPCGASGARRGPECALGQGLCSFVFLSLVVLLFGASGWAQTITGTVINGTTGKPAAGDTIALLSLSQGMQEVASTKSDAQGKFSLAVPADQRTPHMVRATHGGVSYFPQGGPLMPGATTAEITVYDTAAKVEPLTETVEVDRYQHEDGKPLQAIVLFAIRNQSNPPRTQQAARSFEFVLPPGATLDSGFAKSPGGQPVNSPPTPTGQKNQYAFSLPLKPGETQFQITYHLPYEGEATFSPRPLGDVQHFVIMTPKGMTFTAKNAKLYQPMPDDSGANIMVATNVKPGDDLGFRIAGTGVFQADTQGNDAGGDQGASAGGAMGGGQAAANDNRPGGGLGAPIDAPDPLHDYRAFLLGGFALVLVMGGAYVVSKSNHKAHPAAVGAGAAEDYAVEPLAPLAKDRSATLLEALKEELFQLELDRQQNKISADEYAKAKAALDETIRRAVARKAKS